MVPETVSHFIGGRRVHSTLRKTYGVTNPATGKEYAQVEVGLGADINQAVLAAQAALRTGPWAKTTAADRARVLRDIADAIDSRASDIAADDGLSSGLPVTQATEQAGRAAELFRRAAGSLTGPAASGAAVAADAAGGFGTGGAARDFEAGGGTGCVVTRPAGIAGVITSWRTPFLAQARAVAPALAAGCTVVLKADDRAPLPAARLAEIVTAAGLPDGVLNVVHGSLHRKAPGAQARDALIAHPSVARLSFAGETPAGDEVAREAAARRVRLHAEPAGGSPCIIFADAELDKAVDSALFGAFALNGQRRTATSVILAERSGYEAVVSRLAQRADRIRVGVPADPATELGPLVCAEHYDELVSAVRLGIREGARLAAGGRRPAGLPEGNYFAATVLADVAPPMRIFTEEIRGPLVRVTPFDTDDEAVALAGTMERAPAAYLWTADTRRARRVAASLDAAGTWVNSHNSPDLLSAAGSGSGSGSAEADVDFYTRSRTVFIAADDTPVPVFGA